MSDLDTDTIFALASGSGRAAIAVVRVSGPATQRMLGAMMARLPAPRRASLRRLRRPHKKNGYDPHGAVIDEAVIIWTPGPASFTGEDAAELHLHGGPAIIAAVAETLMGLGAKPAQPGAFSRRAFAHGKLDLTQAEAIADLVDAETEAQRAQALRQLQGDLGALYEGWRVRLVSAMALLEADIDFPDEGDVQDHAGDDAGGSILTSNANETLRGLATEIQAHLADGRRGERVRDGFQVAIIGPPNAGKSTLLNALLARDAAIVTDIPGTTRDVVEGRLVLDGFLILLADTAGLRDTADVVEREGVARARRRAEDADLRVLVVDASGPIAQIIETQRAHGSLLRDGDIILLNKVDRLSKDALSNVLNQAFAKDHVTMPPDPRASDGAPDGVFADAISIHQAAAHAGPDDPGVRQLKAGLARAATQRLAAAEAPSLTRARHRQALEDAVAALDAAMQHAGATPELAGEDARRAAQALGSITGRIDVEEILDRVFRDFCIGK